MNSNFKKINTVVIFFMFANLAFCQLDNIIYVEKFKGCPKSIHTIIYQHELKSNSIKHLQKTNDTLIHQWGAMHFNDEDIQLLAIRVDATWESKAYVVNFLSDSVIVKMVYIIEGEDTIELDKRSLERLGSLKGVMSQSMKFKLLESAILETDSMYSYKILDIIKNRYVLKNENNDKIIFKFDKMNNLKLIKRYKSGKLTSREKIKIYEKDKLGNWTKKYHMVNGLIVFTYIRTIVYEKK